MSSHRTALKKRQVLELLLNGESPGNAALAVEISRRQLYNWRSQDERFAEKWDDAVQTGIDKLESLAYKRAINGSDSLLTMYLKCRRPEVWNPDRQIANNTLNLKVTTFYDAMSKIERLGLPAPLIEYDEFEDDK
jgi:hypothetical protein